MVGVCTPRSSLVLAVALGHLSVGCGDVRYRDGVTAEQPVEKILLAGDVGVVDIVPGEVAKIEYAVRAPDGAANVQSTEGGGQLSTTARCHTPVLCSVDVQVHVPDGVGVEVDLGLGEVWSTGVSDLSVSVAQGDVDVDTAGNVTVQVGQGSVRVKTAGSESVRVAVGDGDIAVEASPDQWNLNITARSESNDGIIDNRGARGQMELVAPSGTVTLRTIRRALDSGTP